MKTLDLPFERRPVKVPSEAKRVALQSYREQQLRERGGKRPAKGATKKRSSAKPSARQVAYAIRYRVAEDRRREMLQRAHPGSDASLDGVADGPRYSPAEVDALGKRGLAFRRRNGTYAWPCVDRRDLLLCLAQWSLDVDEALAVKQFIRARAIVMGRDEDLPKGWYTPPQKPKKP
jgi:hypothetical protein